MIPIDVPAHTHQGPPILGPDGIDGRLDLCEVDVGAARIISDGVVVKRPQNQ